MQKTRLETVTLIPWFLPIILLWVCTDLRAERIEDKTIPVGVGNGDGRIWVIPTLSQPSIKNGDRVTIQAVIKSVAPVQGVKAYVVPETALGERKGTELRSALSGLPALARFALTRADSESARGDSGFYGLWQSEWVGRGLEEGYYRVCIQVTDDTGHTFVDDTLRFSDPIAGINTVGSTSYPNGLIRRLDAVNFVLTEGNLTSAVVDTAAGFAYFGTDTVPGVVVKVMLGTGTGAPTRVGSVTLNAGENYLRAAVIDTANGYAYFGTWTSPGRVVKVALGAGSNPPVRIGALTLNSGENSLRCAVADPANGYAYFGTETSPARVVKVALGVGPSLPTRVGAVTFNSGENSVYSAVIDTTNGYAYFGTYTTPGRVVKVNLGVGSNPPTRVGAVTLNSGENYLTTAVIDPGDGYAYFGTNTSPGLVVKVALGAGATPPSRVGTATLGTGENNLRSAIVDPATDYAFFGTNTSPGRVIKVALGSGITAPSRVGAVTLNSGENRLLTAVADIANGYGYFGSYTLPGRVAKVALGVGAAPPTRTAGAILDAAENNLRTALMDVSNGYAYFGTGTAPGRVVKISMSDILTVPARIGAVTADPGEDYFYCGVIDAANGYAYFGTLTSPGRVVKVALGAGSAQPTRVGAVTLNPGEDNLYCAVIDAANGYAYFGTLTSPGRVIKVALGAGAGPPTRVGAVTLNPGENNLSTAVIDASNGYAYFGTDTMPGIVVKVALGAGAAPPTRVAATMLSGGENALSASVIDTANGYAYFGTATAPGRIVKVQLGAGASAPVRMGAVTAPTGADYIQSGVIDETGGYAVFGTDTTPGWLVKVALGSGSNPPTLWGTLTLTSGDDALRCAAIDPTRAIGYFGGWTNPGRVVRASLSHKGYINGTLITVPEEASITNVHLYAHQLHGNVRLGLYTTASTPVLVWQSASTAVNVTEDWVSVSLPYVVIPSGNYWLTWQTDSSEPVGSYNPGTPASGFYTRFPYGPFPSPLSLTLTSTSYQWSGYITYSIAPAPPSNPGATNITETSITWTWQDNSPDETGFLVYDDPGVTPPSTLQEKTAADVTQWTHSGLSPNTAYTMQVAATNEIIGLTSAPTAPYTAWTLANVPVAPTVANPTQTTLDVTLNADGNPAYTLYALEILPGVGGNTWVQADGSLGAAAAYQTAATWGTTTVTGLTPSTTYQVHALAQNGAGVDTAFGPAATEHTLANVPAAPLVSNPSTNTFDVAIAADGNGSAALYALEVLPGVGGNTWVQADGSLGGAAVYQSAAAWGTVTVTGLDPSSTYTVQATAQNPAGLTAGPGPSATVDTLANVPAAPTVGNPGVHRLDVTLNPDGNPPTTTYALLLSPPVGGNTFVQADGSVGAAAVYQTAAVWGTTTITGLAPATSYSVQAIARNNAGVDTLPGAAGLGTTLASVSIATQPTGAALYVGQSHTFTVVAADGEPPYTYQWRRNGVDLPGETGPSLSVTNATLADAGTYDVVVTDTLSESTTSVGAQLVVANYLSIVTQSSDLTVTQGDTVVLSVTTAGGIGPLVYQWYKDGVPIPGANGPSLTFSPVDVGDTGVYTCQVLDSFNNDVVVTSPITLTVMPGVPVTTVAGLLFLAASVIVTAIGYLRRGKTAVRA